MSPIADARPDHSDPAQIKLFSPRTVFGLYSPAMGSGKSEVAKVLVGEYGAKLVKFAGPLKEMTKVLLLHMGVSPSDIDRCVEGDLKEQPVPGWLKENDPDFNRFSNGPPQITPRRIMQTLGTEWRDLIDRELWSKIAIENIKEALAQGHHVVVDDMRFVHEMEVIRQLGGKTVYVKRPAAVVTQQHRSEGALEGFEFDHLIRNEGTLTDLRWAVRDLMEKFK